MICVLTAISQTRTLLLDSSQWRLVVWLCLGPLLSVLLCIHSMHLWYGDAVWTIGVRRNVFSCSQSLPVPWLKSFLFPFSSYHYFQFHPFAFPSINTFEIIYSSDCVYRHAFSTFVARLHYCHFYRASCASMHSAIVLYQFYRSVRWRYCVETIARVVKRFSTFWLGHHSSFYEPTTVTKFQGDPLSRDVKYTWVWKICDFRPKSSFVSETVRYMAIVTMVH